MIPVVIPFYKNGEQLHKCRRHLAAQTVLIDVFIRDNSKDNIYFTAAVNEGIRKYLTDPNWDYILIINQDMYLQANALREMLKFMDSHLKCGIGMPIQVTSDNEDLACYAGGAQAFPKGSALAGNVQLYWADAKIPWASGGCLILRREMIQEIGLFDKNLRFVGSDSDYCFTARSRGWEVWRIAQAVGVHEDGQAITADCGEALNLIKVEDMLYFASKWLTGDLYRGLADRCEDTTAEKIQKEIADMLTIKRTLHKA